MTAREERPLVAPEHGFGEGDGGTLRERALVGAFVDLAAALAGDGDAESLLALTCERCASLLGAATEVAIVIGGMPDLPSVVAASGERARYLATFDTLDGSSPATTSRASGMRVAWQGDLDGFRRPGFTAAARAVDIGSVQAVPLRCADRVVGVLMACRDDHAPFSPDDALAAQAVGDVAATAVVHGRSTSDAARLVEQLQHALDSRIVLEQAKGIIAEQAGVGVDEAFRRLRAYARDHDRSLTDTATNVVQGTLPAGDRERLLARRPEHAS